MGHYAAGVRRGPRVTPLVRVQAWVRSLFTAERRFWGLVVVTGLLAGLGAVALIEILRFAQHLAWGEAGESFLGVVEQASLWRRAVVPVLGGVLVVAVSLLVGQPMRGHGTAGIIEGIWTRSGKMDLPRALLRGLVSILAVAAGAPLGREGALLSTGAASGSALARTLRLSADQTRLLVACGAAAGVAAAYNVPIGAALFGLEVLLGSMALELFGPIVLACVVATLVSRMLISDHPSYLIPHYALNSPREIALSIGLGLLLGPASALYVRGVNLFSDLGERAPKQLALFLPIVAMAVVGGCATFAPQVLGNGYDVVNHALRGQLPWALLLLLPLLKLALTSLSAGLGVPGGLFTPSLFFGALLGGAFGVFAHWAFPGTAPAGAYALLGMGAVLAGTTHASISAVLIIFELTGDYGMILPLMLSSVIAAALSKRLAPDSLYTSVLRRRNVLIPGMEQPGWLKSGGARPLVEKTDARVDPGTSFQEVVVRLLEVETGEDLYVTQRDGRLLGTIILEELKGQLPNHALLQDLTAEDVMSRAVPRLSPTASLSEVAATFSRNSFERLPVVDERGVLLGTISKGALLKQGRF